MPTDQAKSASAIFAANRARGAVSFDVHQADGATRRGRLHESGSLRVRFPSPEAEGLSAVFVNTAGGIAGGDRFDIDISVGEAARLTVTTAAAARAIYNRLVFGINSFWFLFLIVLMVTIHVF